MTLNGLKVSGLSYKSILTDVSLELDFGKLTVLLGPNGSGKTTLLKLMAGLIPNENGSVALSNENLSDLKPRDRARKIRYLSGDIKIDFPLTVREVVGLGNSNGHASRLKKALIETDILKLQDRNVQYLSGGELQRVMLAQALVGDAKVLLLDEALSRTDIKYRVVLGDLLKNLSRDGYLILLVTHDLQLAKELADETVYLEDGRRSNKFMEL